METESLMRAVPQRRSRACCGCCCGFWAPLTLDFVWERHRSRLVTALSLLLVLQSIFVDGLAGFTIQQCVEMYAAADPLGPTNSFSFLPTLVLQMAFIVFGGLAASGYHHRLWIVLAMFIAVALLVEQSRETRFCVTLASGDVSEMSVCALMGGASGSCDGMSAYLTVGATAAINSVSWFCTAMAAIRLAWLLVTHVLRPCCRIGVRSLCYGECEADADREARSCALVEAARSGFPGYTVMQRWYAYGHFVPLRIMLALLVVALFLVIFPMWLSSATKALVASVASGVASVPSIYRVSVIFDTAIPIFVACVAAVAYSQVFAITFVVCGAATTVWLSVRDHVACLQRHAGKKSVASPWPAGHGAAAATAEGVYAAAGGDSSRSCCGRPCPSSVYTAPGVLPDGSLDLAAFAYLDAPDVLYLFVANALVVYASTTVLFTVAIALFIFPPTRSYAIATTSTALVTTVFRLLLRMLLSKLLVRGGTHLPFPRVFLIVDAALTFTFGFIFGLGTGALRVCIGITWGVARCAQMGRSILPAQLALYDAGFNAYGAMIKVRCAGALGEEERAQSQAGGGEVLLPPRSACWWLGDGDVVVPPQQQRAAV